MVLTLLAVCEGVVNVKNSNGETPLHIALAKNAADGVVEAIIAAGSSSVLKEKNAAGNTPLHVALANHRSEMIVLALMVTWSVTVTYNLTIYDLQLHRHLASPPFPPNGCTTSSDSLELSSIHLC